MDERIPAAGIFIPTGQLRDQGHITRSGKCFGDDGVRFGVLTIKQQKMIYADHFRLVGRYGKDHFTNFFLGKFTGINEHNIGINRLLGT